MRRGLICRSQGAPGAGRVSRFITPGADTNLRSSYLIFFPLFPLYRFNVHIKLCDVRFASPAAQQLSDDFEVSNPAYDGLL